MSIATLKKKTMHKYNNSSVGHTQFSLNGSHRSQGFVGQTSLSRSIIKTPMKGNIVKGHGGKKGTYQQNVLFSSLNDPPQIKSSLLSSNGMIKQKYKWKKRPLPFSIFKPKIETLVNSILLKTRLLLLVRKLLFLVLFHLLLIHLLLIHLVHPILIAELIIGTK
jgi:hypothetical protein